RLLMQYWSLKEDGSIPEGQLDGARALLHDMWSAAQRWLGKNRSKKDDTKITKRREQRGAGMVEFLEEVNRETAVVQRRIWRRDERDERDERIEDLPEPEPETFVETKGPGPEPEPEPWQDQL